MMRTLSLGLRTYARYALPLTLLSLLAFAPLLVLAARLPSPANAASARETVRALWGLLVLALVGTLALTGAASPLVRSSMTQLAALRGGLRGLVGALLPVLAALFAIVVGLAALVFPGLILLPLLAYVGASTERGIAARFAQSAAMARAHLATAIGVLVIVVGVTAICITVLFLRLPLPVAKKPSITDLQMFHSTFRIAAVGCAFLAPLLASLLAAVPALQAPADSAEVHR